MPVSNKLTARFLKAEMQSPRDKVKVFSDGDGLYVRIRPDGSASFFFTKHIKDKPRRELGLGSASATDLATARELAAEARKAIALGRDPFAEKAAAKRETKEEVAKAVTFGALAEDYLTGFEANWKNDKHRAQWKSTLRTYAAPLWKKRVDEVSTDDVLAVLNPIWSTKAETASRVRGRIERILDVAKARGLRPRDSFNPAMWRGHMQILLGARKHLTRGHHTALPFKDAPGFMAELRTRTAMSARALEFTILTAARTGEALGAQWGEIDMDAATWTVPAARMKAGKEHIVPLSAPAIALLAKLRPGGPAPDSLVFGKQSNMCMAMLLRRMGVDATVHGFRSTFRDWAGEEAKHPREVIEMALAHTIQNKAERAYRRGTAVERRRELMTDWAAFLAAPAVKTEAAPMAPRPGRRVKADNPHQVKLFDAA